MRRYISENGTDSDQCGQTAKTACKTMTNLLEQSHRNNPFVDPDLLDQVENVWDPIFNQFWSAFVDIERFLSMNSTMSPDIYPQVCTEEQMVNYTFYYTFSDGLCNLIKDIYFSRIISHEDRDYFNSSLDTYCRSIRNELMDTNLYVNELNCSNSFDIASYLLFGILGVEQTKYAMTSKLKLINVNILTVTNVKMNNEVFPAVGPYHFHCHFIPASNRIIHIDISNNTFHNVHLHLDNSRMSAHIKDNVFTQSGITISSPHATTHQQVILENSVFQGDNSEEILEVRNTTNIIISSCIFKNLISGMLCYNSQIEMHDIMFKNVSFPPVVTFENCRLYIHNFTVFKNNLFNVRLDSLMRIKYSEGTIENIKFEKNNGSCFSIVSGNITIQNLIATGNNPVNIEHDLQSNIGHILQSNMSLNNAFIFNNTGAFFFVFQSTMNISSCILKHNSNSHIRFMDLRESNVFITDTVFEDNIGHGLIGFSFHTEVVVSKSRFLLNRITRSLIIADLDIVSYDLDSYYIVINDSEFNNNQGEIVECKHCPFGNYASSGVVARMHSRSMQFSNCSFSNNVASGTAGILFAYDGKVSLFNCTVTNNTAYNEAGAFDLYNSSLLVKDSVFINNSCGVEGGVISAYRKSTLEISNSIFWNNKAEGADGGAIFLEDESKLESNSCQFIGNIAALGGGAVMVVDHSSYSDTGSTFTKNTAADNGKFITYIMIYHFKFILMYINSLSPAILKRIVLFRWSHICS